MGDFALNLPKTSINLRYLEKKSKVQEKKQSPENGQLSNCFPDAAAEAVEFSETDTSPVMTMTGLRSTRPGIDNSEELIGGVVNPAGSIQDSDVNNYSDHKFQSVTEREMQTSVQKSVQSIATFLRGPSVSGGVTEKVLHVDINGDQEKSQECLKSTPVKSVSGMNYKPTSMIFSCESPPKRFAGKTFVILTKRQSLKVV